MELNAFPLSAPDSESVRKSSKEKRPINARSGAVSAVKVCPLTHTHTVHVSVHTLSYVRVYVMALLDFSFSM